MQIFFIIECQYELLLTFIYEKYALMINLDLLYEATGLVQY